MEIPVVRRANATKDITAMNSFIHRPVGAFPLELRPCVSPFPFGGSGCLPTSASLTSTPCNGISSEVDMCNVSYDLGSSLAAVNAWLVEILAKRCGCPGKINSRFPSAIRSWFWKLDVHVIYYPWAWEDQRGPDNWRRGQARCACAV